MAGDAARDAVGRKSRVTPRVGTFVAADGLQALVDVAGQRVSVQFACAFVPEVNEPVWVDSIDGVLRLIGPTNPKPGFGVVLSLPDATHVTVDTAFGAVTMPFHAADTLTAGDVVGIVWSSGPKCFKMSTSPDHVVPPPDPGGSGTDVKTAEFRAIDAGSTDRGSARWWQAQPWASNTTFGAWFYGTQIKDTVPADAVFVSLEFYVAFADRSGAAPRFTLHSSPFKAGVPAMTGYTEWAPGGGYQTPPDPEGWFAALKAGGPMFGVGLNQGGFNKFKSPRQGSDQDAMSGAIRIKWR